MESSRSKAMDQAQRSVRRTVKDKADTFRRAAPTAVFGLLAGSALAPLAADLGPGGPGVATALAAVVGGIGTNLLSERVSKAIENAHGQDPGEGGTEHEDAVADAIGRELTEALARNDDSARQLASQAADVMRALGGFEAALSAATGDLRDHLSLSLAEVAQGNSQVIKVLTAIRRDQRQQRVLLEETVDRLRAPGAPDASAPSGAAQASATPVIPVFAAAPATRTGEAPLEKRWRAGEDGWLGGRRYLLIQDPAGLLREQHDGSGESVRRQALAKQTLPGLPAKHAYAWLRHGGHGLTRERDLLSRVRAAGTSRDLPVVAHYDATAGAITLALSWPTGRDALPSETVGACFQPGTLDEWRISLLCAGLGGLAHALRRLHELDKPHRNLTPAGIIAVSDRRFALRDLGLAAADFRPGEAPGDYQAPEQAFGARNLGPVGPATDVYQLAAIAYHLISGRVPVASGRVPPLRHNALSASVGTVITASLSLEPAGRPSPQEFGVLLQPQR